MLLMVPSGASVLSHEERERVPAAFLRFRFTLLTMYAYEQVVGLKLEEWRLVDDQQRFESVLAVQMLRAGLATVEDGTVNVPEFDTVAGELTMLNYEVIAKLIALVMQASTPELPPEEAARAKAEAKKERDWLGIWAYCRQDLQLSEEETWSLTLKMQRALAERCVERMRQAERQLSVVAAFFANGHFGSKSHKWGPGDFQTIREAGTAKAPAREEAPVALFERVRNMNRLIGGTEVVA